MHARPANLEPSSVLAGRILIVHEDPAFTCAVRRLLNAAGYFVIECNSPEQAVVSILRGDEYDLVLIDVPGRAHVAMNLHHAILAMNEELASRVVFLAESDVDLPASSPRITKPIELDALRDWLAEFVTLRTQPPHGGPLEP